MAQKLITAEVKKFLKKHPSGSQDGLNGEAKVACRLFCPFSHALTWYVLEGYEDNENLAYGYVVNNSNNDFSEYGDIDLSELAKLRQCGCPAVERDISIPVGMKLSEALEKSSDPLRGHFFTLRHISNMGYHPFPLRPPSPLTLPFGFGYRMLIKCYKKYLTN